jgi:excisionase family DNA binding protein
MMTAMQEDRRRVGEPLWDVSEAAKYLKCSRDWIYKKCASGELPHRRVGRGLRFFQSELQAWVASQPGGPRD